MPEVAAPPVRYAEVHYGDDLRKIALREMGSARRWVDLAILNGLRPPYIADEAAYGVLAYGDQIMVPAPGSSVPAETAPADLFGTDLLVSAKRLLVENGDFAIVSGIANLSQSLTHHIMVEKGELAFHPGFGSYVRALVGRGNGPAVTRLAAFYAKSALLEDPRVDSVSSCTAEASGDQIRIAAVVVPITGKPVEMRVLI